MYAHANVRHESAEHSAIRLSPCIRVRVTSCLRHIMSTTEQNPATAATLDAKTLEAACSITRGAMSALVISLLTRRLSLHRIHSYAHHYHSSMYYVQTSLSDVSRAFLLWGELCLNHYIPGYVRSWYNIELYGACSPDALDQ